MQIEQSSLLGVWIIRNKVFHDERGSFQEWFNHDRLSEIAGINFRPVQANRSISKEGVLRGIHYSLADEGQAKIVTCTTGSILDVVFDLRRTSTTFGSHATFHLNANDGVSLYIADGLGHSFLSLEDNSTLVYLVSSTYNSELEFAINPFDTSLNYTWPNREITLSNKDRQAKSLIELFESKELPN